jgi:mRNA interferase MazF
MYKDFDRWNRLKKGLESTSELPTFNEREVWWCSFGMNIGYELFGKGEKFWRPVLVLSKHNAHSFFGLPLGSTIKQNPRHYFRLDFDGRQGSALLSQGRILSTKRLSNLMGTLSETKFHAVKAAYKDSL